MADTFINIPSGSSGSGGITDINSQTGPSITIAAGTGISVLASSNTITITNTVSDTGITQLTGDVTAGPGSGSQVATLAASIAGTHAFTGDISVKDLSITGTAGAGFIQYASQSAAPSVPVSGFRAFADASNRPTWENTSGNLTIFDNTAVTANRTYTLRDVSGKFLLDSRLSLAFTTLTAGTTTILNTDAFAGYFLNSTSGSITVNLPTAASVADRAYIFKGISGNMETNNFNLVPNGTDRIEGLNATKIFQTNYGAWTLVSDGISAWWMI